MIINFGCKFDQVWYQVRDIPLLMGNSVSVHPGKIKREYKLFFSVGGTYWWLRHKKVQGKNNGSILVKNQ